MQIPKLLPFYFYFIFISFQYSKEITFKIKAGYTVRVSVVQKCENRSQTKNVTDGQMDRHRVTYPKSFVRDLKREIELLFFDLTILSRGRVLTGVNVRVRDRGQFRVRGRVRGYVRFGDG